MSTEMEALSAAKWPLYLDSEGRILDEYTVRKIAFHKGISAEICGEVWTFLLDYFPFNSTSEERRRIDEDRRASYNSMLKTWNSDSFTPMDNFEDYAKLIEKDSVRTDRNLEFFSDANMHNVYMLERVLKTFLILRPEMGYVQGMSDMLAPLLIVLASEHQAFWCFDFVMRTMGTVFSDLTLSEPLTNLATLCHHIDRPLYEHLNTLCEGEQWLFSYKWILLNFKRELSLVDVCRLWECFWSCHATVYFPLLFAASVLLHFREPLLQYTNFEQLMQFSQDLNGKIPVATVLSRAISLLDQLKSDKYCPHDIKFLVSNEICAPPPLVGFVRARQKVASLYSNRMEIQRHQIWKTLFGDTPVQSITSPFMLTPATFSLADVDKVTPTTTTAQSLTQVTTPPEHGLDTCTPSDVNENGKIAQSGSPMLTPPPKIGFIPRENMMQLRDDIRKLQPTNATAVAAEIEDRMSCSRQCPIDERSEYGASDRNHIPSDNSCHVDADLKLAGIQPNVDSYRLYYRPRNGGTTERSTAKVAATEITSAPPQFNEESYAYQIPNIPPGSYRPVQTHTTGHFELEKEIGWKCLTQQPTLDTSAVLSGSAIDSINGEAQFDELRSEAELTCY